MATAGETWYQTAEWHMLKRSEFPYEFAEDSVIRYIDLTDARDLESIVTYIKSLPLINPKVNGQYVGGLWQTLEVGYGPVDQNRPHGTSPIRVWHALIPEGNTTGTGFYVTENGCKYKVSLSFFWRLSVFPPALPESSSGIQYAIGSVVRDPQSGLWSCTIEKRETISQTTGVWTAAKSLFETVLNRKWTGLRTGDLTSEGTPADLDNVATASPGTTIEEDRNKNADCTQDVAQSKTVANEVLAATVRMVKTLFAIRTDTKNTASASPLGAPPEPVGGVRYEHTNVKRKDQLTDTEQDEIIERPVTDATVAVDDNQFSTTTVKKHRSQAAASENAGNPAVGTLVATQNDKTEGALVDVSETTKTAKSVSDAVVSYVVTLFNSVTNRTHANQPDAPAPVTAPVGGLIVKREGTKNPDRTHQIEESQTQELPVADAVRTVRKTLFATVTSYLHRAQAAALPDPTVPGVTVENTKTEGALVNQQSDVITPVQVDDAVVFQTGDFSSTIDRRLHRNRPSPDTTPSGLYNAGTPSAEILSIENTRTDEDKVNVQRVSDKPGPFATNTVASLIQINGTNMYEYTVTFINATEYDLTSIVLQYQNYHAIPGFNWNKWELMEGQIKFVPWEVYGGVDNTLVDETGIIEYETSIVKDGGKIIKRNLKYTFDLKRDSGISTGASDYSGAMSGSSFHTYGIDRYEYKKVTSILLYEYELGVDLVTWTVTINGVEIGTPAAPPL